MTDHLADFAVAAFQLRGVLIFGAGLCFGAIVAERLLTRRAEQ